MMYSMKDLVTSTAIWRVRRAGRTPRPRHSRGWGEGCRGKCSASVESQARDPAGPDLCPRQSDAPHLVLPAPPPLLSHTRRPDPESALPEQGWQGDRGLWPGLTLPGPSPCHCELWAELCPLPQFLCCSLNARDLCLDIGSSEKESQDRMQALGWPQSNVTVLVKRRDKDTKTGTEGGPCGDTGRTERLLSLPPETTSPLPLERQHGLVWGPFCVWGL